MTDKYNYKSISLRNHTYKKLDIKKYVKKLPEHNKYKDFTFEQKHTVLESGNVRHSYTLKPPKKNGEDK